MSEETDIERLELSPYRRRVKMHPITAEEIHVTESFGLSKPILVRQKAGGEGCYEILQGARDWHLAQRAGLYKIPIKILHHLTDEEARQLVDAEAQREGRGDPIEEAEQIQDLQSREGLSLNAVADRLGQRKQTLSNRLRLLKLDPYVQNLVREGRLQEAKARALVGLPANDQINIAERVTRHNLSTRKTEVLARERKIALGTLQKRKTKAQSRPPHIDAQRAHDAPPKNTASKDPDTRALEQSLTERFGCAVSIDRIVGAGWSLSFECHGLDELDGIIEKLQLIP